MKKKIIFVTKALWIGGIETALVNLLKYFNYDKYDVTLLILRAELDMLHQIHPKCRVLIADREKTITFSEKYRHSRLFHLAEESEQPSRFHKMMMWTVPAIRWIENRLYIRYIRKIMQEERFDTAVIYSDVVGETAVRAIKAKKYLMFYHHGAMRHVYHDKIAYRKCDRIIVVSENLAKELRRFIPEYSHKIVTVHNLADVVGIRKRGMEPIPEHFNSREFNIVSVGRISHEKGMDLAVKICAGLVEAGYDNVRWWIVGDGPDMPKVKKMVAEWNMENHVIIVGMKKNPYPYIRQANLYVQPSRVEGYPMTILEALIMGQPVVSFNNTGAREILTEGKTGKLVRKDVDKMKEVIESLLREPNRINEMRANLRELDFSKMNLENVEKIEEYI